MKDQYFGDVNDYRKYGLLRLLNGSDRLRLGVCWMLTANDARTDGRLRSYLNEPHKYRHRDPDLFDWLKQAVGEKQDRRVARIEASGLLGDAVFQSRILTDDKFERKAYFAECGRLFYGRNLVFFDPDNGLEVQSTRPGNRNSCKYLFWEELCRAYGLGSSVLVYQHFPRVERNMFTARLAEELWRRTGAPAIFTYRTSHVLFILAAQARHVDAFRGQLGYIRSQWAGQLMAAEPQVGFGALVPGRR